ncbi:hypothetical protein BST81_22915 [Leptolyngbya sp. 'hensonii']|uniref:hypothetical protein n=1 Tax=Leptolyngbya sp. 'hensonii' TaxID=1922337 RepID=UPI00094F6113|nr:hypothetical protein [Leptolyngbya sp. 'hensonii']OLP16082.1 hypothetical protein BST81_22915 [Leptolyngbya sp. 'hensonii']
MSSLPYILTIGGLSLLLSSLLGCVGIQTTAPLTNPINSPVVQTAQAPTPQSSPAQVKFKVEDKAAFELKLRPDGAKLVDASDKEVARFKTDGAGKVKIKDGADRELGYIVPEKATWKVKSADQSKVLYVLRRQQDGDYKLEDGADQPIYRIKARDYGFELETPAQQSLYKVKVKDGKISLRDRADKTVLSTKSQFAPIAMACFGFDVLKQEQKAALAYAVNRSGGQ